MRAWLGYAAALALAGLLSAVPASAKGPKKSPAAERLAHITARGRPTVKLEALEFPNDVPAAAHFKHYLRRRLAHEARRVRWGAGRNNVIEFRFKVTELTITREDEAIHVRCSAVGRLPGGQAAKSHLTFGGSPAKRNKLIERVLDIVARGVVTRLAELERIRRGELVHARVRTRVNPDTQ
jgi:hypothetical protein